jgi:Uma2 family endonuclease
MSTIPKSKLTPGEYLAKERLATYRSEFFRGEIFAMVGASRRHNLITGNVGRRISEQLDGRACEVYQSDMRVKVNATGLYTYPDVVVTCHAPRFEDGQSDTLLNPQVICEVLSKSTEAYDRGKKFEHYRQIPSLREYILIAQDSCQIERFCRDSESGKWVLSESNNLQGTMELESIACTLRLSDVYMRVDFLDPEEDPIQTV